MLSELESTEIMIGREDWERFLSSMERLMSAQERIIDRYRELNRNNDVLRRELKKALNTPRSFAAQSLVPTTPRISPEFQRPSENAYRISERILEWLKPPGTRTAERRPPTLQPIFQPPPVTTPGSQVPYHRPSHQTQIIRCGGCGYELSRPGKVCERCGVSYGAFYCRCGKILLPGDRFCDNCGTVVS